MHPHESASRRAAPRLIDTDWLVLRGLGTGIDGELAAVGRLGQVAVDFGCGSQPYRRRVEAAGIVYRGADLGHDADIVIGMDGRVDADDATADLVLSFQVLEHVRDLATYLGEARRLLRPGGRLILSTHGTWLYHPHPEDHRRWTRQGLMAELEAHGFAIENVRSIVGPLAWTTLIRLAGYAYALRRLPLVGPAIASALALAMNSRAWLEDRITPQPIRDDNGCVYLVRARVAA